MVPILAWNKFCTKPVCRVWFFIEWKIMFFFFNFFLITSLLVCTNTLFGLVKKGQKEVVKNDWREKNKIKCVCLEEIACQTALTSMETNETSDILREPLINMGCMIETLRWYKKKKNCMYNHHVLCINQSIVNMHVKLVCFTISCSV